jgi:hypothetical protein
MIKIKKPDFIKSETVCLCNRCHTIIYSCCMCDINLSTKKIVFCYYKGDGEMKGIFHICYNCYESSKNE